MYNISMKIINHLDKPAVIVIIFTLSVIFSCRTTPSEFSSAEQSMPPSAQTVENLPSPVIYTSAYQETFYNGRQQPIAAKCVPEIPLIIIYYNSKYDYWAIQNGFYDPPAEPGLYYVSVNCAPGYGYNLSDDLLVEYRIKKASVSIIAEAVQNAVYNGSPRRVQATSDPAVPMSYSYYPNPELRQAAAEVFKKPDYEIQSSLSSALQRFQRVESAPSEQGTYYVLVYFNGNEKYEPAYIEIEFTIHPAARRN